MRITRIRSYPLTVPIGDLQRTSQGSFGTISILVVVVETDAGHQRRRRGPRALCAEGLCRAGRRAARAEGGRHGPVRRRARLAGDVPRLLRARRRHADRGDRRRSTSRCGTSWARRPGSRCTGCWAAWGASASRLRLVDPWARRCAARAGPSAARAGLQQIKVKIGAPARPRSRAAQLVREVAGPTMSALGRRELDLQRRRGAGGRRRAGRARLFLVRGADRAGGSRRLSAGCARRRRSGWRRARASITAQRRRDLHRGARGRRDPARRRARRRHQRDAADRRSRPRAARRPTRRMSASVGRDLRRGEPAARRRDAEFPDLRVHDVRRTRCASC